MMPGVNLLPEPRRTVTYEKDGAWFWACSGCQWFDGGFPTEQEAEDAAKAHECRRAS
jgi:hypothetical protein